MTGRFPDVSGCEPRTRPLESTPPTFVVVAEGKGSARNWEGKTNAVAPKKPRGGWGDQLPWFAQPDIAPMPEGEAVCEDAD